jgi:hypothetical protein
MRCDRRLETGRESSIGRIHGAIWEGLSYRLEIRATIYQRKTSASIALNIRGKLNDNENERLCVAAL